MLAVCPELRAPDFGGGEEAGINSLCGSAPAFAVYQDDGGVHVSVYMDCGTDGAH